MAKLQSSLTPNGVCNINTRAVITIELSKPYKHEMLDLTTSFGLSCTCLAMRFAACYHTDKSVLHIMKNELRVQNGSENQ